jgi:peptidoglycan/xylan/chitin deacetylase (PgdA/CDA1 family)
MQLKMNNIERKFQSNYNKILCYFIRKAQKPIWCDRSKGYLTIFFDYEGDYALPSKKRAQASVYGVKRMIKICKKHNISATFNTVGKLFDDHPDIIKKIIDDGHDIASHSYNHSTMNKLNIGEIEEDFQESKRVFKQHGLLLNGFRSPQSRWNFRQMNAMLKNDFSWSAENDRADFPYIICRQGKNKLVRFPVKLDDWDYISNKVGASEMYEKLCSCAIKTQKNKCYAAIGFHPWVNGMAEDRLDVFDKFLAQISSMENLVVLTFQSSLNLIRSHEK